MWFAAVEVVALVPGDRGEEGLAAEGVPSGIRLTVEPTDGTNGSSGDSWQQ
ncbi:hypothetical protein GCM10010272_32000 [Streptomyces lateritius]|nr:hypothetical protein GCM10010272_32000 [Streptomyces lateritius]